jgi:hypothetical protein
MSKLRYEGRKELTVGENDRLDLLSNPLLSMNDEALGEWLDENVTDIEDSKELFKQIIKVISEVVKY